MLAEYLQRVCGLGEGLVHLMIGKPIELTTALSVSNCLELVEANVQPTTQVFGGKELTGTIQNGILLATLRQVGQIGGYVWVKARFTEGDNCTSIRCKFEVTTGMLLVGGPVISLFLLGMAWKVWTAQHQSDGFSSLAIAWIVFVGGLFMCASFIPSSYTQRSRLIRFLQYTLKAECRE